MSYKIVENYLYYLYFSLSNICIGGYLHFQMLLLSCFSVGDICLHILNQFHDYEQSIIN